MRLEDAKYSAAARDVPFRIIVLWKHTSQLVNKITCHDHVSRAYVPSFSLWLLIHQKQCLSYIAHINYISKFVFHRVVSLCTSTHHNKKECHQKRYHVFHFKPYFPCNFYWNTMVGRQESRIMSWLQQQWTPIQCHKFKIKIW